MNVEARLQELATTNEIGEILNAEADFKDAIERALEQLVTLLGLSTGWVFLTRMAQGDTHEGGFGVAAMTGLPPALRQNAAAPLCEGGCDCQWLLRKGRLDTGVNIVHCSRLESATGDKGGLELHASVPLLGKTGPVGILNLAAPGDKHFDEQTLAFLTSIGRQLGVAFERSRLMEERTREARYLATLEERQRLATEMHDSVAQLLFAADLSLKTARESPDEVQRAERLERAGELVEAALSELRALVEVLRPADLTSGLHVALSRLAQRTSDVIRVHLEADPLPLPEGTAEALYRIVQEGLHNTLKHARATNLWIRLERRRDTLSLTIEDDGQGFSPQMPAPGLGLTSMKARAHAVGGRMDLSVREGGGVRVEVTVPWHASS
jgi:two-component system NarL family sensor kinase